MFNRLFTYGPLAWSSAASLAAMLALNVFALSQQLNQAPLFAAPAMIAQGAMA